MNAQARGRTALITGASSGIGEKLAGVFAAHGFDLVLTARGEKRLLAVAGEIREAHGGNVRTIVGDLAEASAPAAIHAELARDDVAVEVLVNNAGFGAMGAFADDDLDNQLNVVHVNVTALTRLTGLFIGDMLRRRKGAILNVASTAAFQPGPLMAVYYASKAYVLFLSEALHEELRGTGVSVTALCPGVTATNFQATASLDGAPLLKFGAADAAGVAEYGFAALMRGRAVAIPGLKNKSGTYLPRFLPRAIVRRVVRRLHVKPDGAP